MVRQSSSVGVRSKEAVGDAVAVGDGDPVPDDDRDPWLPEADAVFEKLRDTVRDSPLAVRDTEATGDTVPVWVKDGLWKRSNVSAMPRKSAPLNASSASDFARTTHSIEFSTAAAGSKF
mmetsp:Transcript_7419/g.23191  ORF Transcript_7419/g.23191 Transcript_7419/m.23191 type:complete len:119 (+) Transcript_7419:1437-1793(+)